jgi:uncharacterized protein YggE
MVGPWCVILGLAAGMILNAGSAASQEESVVTVMGQGRFETKPELARFDASVTTQA